MPTYPGSPRLTVDILLKQPRLISRALTSLTSKRFVADRIFSHGTSDQVAGGAAIYQRSESIFPDRNAEEVGLRSEWPRGGWSEAVLTAIVHKYGLEIPIADETVRRNAMDQMQRAQVKLANAVVKFVDGKAMAMFLAEPAVQTTSASGDWTTAATDIVKDIATARKMIADQDEGYEADTMVVNPAQELDLIIDTDIRNALPRENAGTASILSGQAVPILGLRQIIVTPQLTAGTVLIMASNIVGTIADEAPDPTENYSVFSTGAASPVYVKRYRNDNRDETIVRGARFPAMWISEPKAAVIMTGA